MACANVNSPALTNDTVITVVAVDDCTEAVTSIPVNIPVNLFVVMAPNTWRSWGPAIFCKASLIDFIPYISSAKEPRSVKITQMDINCNFVFLKYFGANIQKKSSFPKQYGVFFIPLQKQ